VGRGAVSGDWHGLHWTQLDRSRAFQHMAEKVKLH
jgi:hypothetical protein